MLGSAVSLLDRVIKHKSNVCLKDDTYRGITDYADTNPGVFKFAKPKRAAWKSKELVTSKRTHVTGFSQKLDRLYDTEEDAFFFSYEKEYKRLEIDKILKGEKLWNGEDLSTEDVFKLCDQFVDRVHDMP